MSPSSQACSWAIESKREEQVLLSGLVAHFLRDGMPSSRQVRKQASLQWQESFETKRRELTDSISRFQQVLEQEVRFK